MAKNLLLKPEVKMLLDELAGRELYASNLYRYLAAKMQGIGMFGAQSFYEKESAEELEHFNILRDYINDMGGVIDMPQVNAIADPIMSIGNALSLSQETELILLRKYVSVYETVEDEMEDCVTAQFLLQFIEIQRKAVGMYGDLIARHELNPSDLLEFDEYLSEK